MAVAFPCGTLLAASPVPVNLRTAASFGALAGGAISGTGDVGGDVGSGTGAIAPAITSSGTIYPTGAPVTMTALADFATAYDDAKNRTYDVLLSAAAFELGGSTLTTGVYKIGAAATLASPVTLDAEGDPDAVFIIQVTGALGATAAVGNVVLTNGAQSTNVFWIVEGAVSLGANTHMEGTLLGGAAITFGAATTISGRALAGSLAGTVALATTLSLPVEPSVVGDRVWFDSNGDGIQDPAETTGIPNVPVALLQLVPALSIDLGTAANFGALAGGAISGTGDVAGDVGSGTGAIAPAITSTGTIYPTGHAVVMTALGDFATAYADGKNRTYDVLLSAAAYELGGSTLTAGIYKIGAAATLASPVTLDAQGNPDAVFIIQVTGALGSTASVGNVILTNNAQSVNVYWIVEGAVSLGAGTHMEGTLLGGAAITFGAATTISGRALAGSAAGTVALATTLSAPTGTPPVGLPPPIVVANTVTDASGNYLFEGVQPATYIVRWDLSSITTNRSITAAKQGGDDAFDSDGVSGDVGGFVATAAIEVLSGTTHLGVDLGLVDTLPAVKTAAQAELTTALTTYLEANYYTAENWTALLAARADGNIAIDAATDPTGVAAAKNAALAAMDAVPTFAETLAANKAAATGALTTALATYLEADYTAENWTTLNTAKTNGDIAINAATNPAGVTTALDAALAAMDAVPTIAETLAAAKAAAQAALAAALATYLETNYYTIGNWTDLITAKTDGGTAINAATDQAGVTAALDAALAALDTVPVTAQLPKFTSITRSPEGNVTLELMTTPNFLLTLQTSTDLMSWSTLTTATPSTDSWTFVHDATLATGPARFYRAFLNP
ncbi:ice-binding family protein [Prosthecobacter sp.]|uniref:ice-binding family protein n=1 Tax=Prosthecobacter sp. TaxID=1965333 RepID=UPI0026140BFB|nr:ice-binding family protein [Prosthecobacter sp.]